MHFTKYSGMMHDSSGSWCPHIVLMRSAGIPLAVSSVMIGTPSPP